MAPLPMHDCIWAWERDNLMGGATTGGISKQGDGLLGRRTHAGSEDPRGLRYAAPRVMSPTRQRAD